MGRVTKSSTCFLVAIILAGCSEPEANNNTVACNENSFRKVDSVYTYYDNGKLKNLTLYWLGKKEKVVMEYDSAGILFREDRYLGDTMQIMKMFYPSGKLWWDVPYINDKTNGVQKKYYESGSLEMEVLYKDAVPVGVERWYYENGKVKTEFFYTKGKITRRKDY